MPLYKIQPSRNQEALPFYRPLDRLVAVVWQKRRLIVPLLIAVLVAAAIFFGLKFWFTHTSQQAFLLLEKNDWSEGEEVLKKYPRSGAATLARLAMGQKALEAQAWDQAISFYQPLLKQLPTDQSLFRIAAYQNLALAYRGKGDQEQALEFIQRAERDPDNPVADYSRLLHAEMLRTSGDREGALKLYTELAEGSQLPTVKAEAESWVQWFKKSKK